MIHGYGFAATFSAEEIFAVRLSAWTSAVEDSLTRCRFSVQNQSAAEQGPLNADRCSNQTVTLNRPDWRERQLDAIPANRYSGMMDTKALMNQRYGR